MSAENEDHINTVILQAQTMAEAKAEVLPFVECGDYIVEVDDTTVWQSEDAYEWRSKVYSEAHVWVEPKDAKVCVKLKVDYEHQPMDVHLHDNSDVCLCYWSDEPTKYFGWEGENGIYEVTVADVANVEYDDKEKCFVFKNDRGDVLATSPFDSVTYLTTLYSNYAMPDDGVPLFELADEVTQVEVEVAQDTNNNNRHFLQFTEENEKQLHDIVYFLLSGTAQTLFGQPSKETIK